MEKVKFNKLKYFIIKLNYYRKNEARICEYEDDGKCWMLL